VCVYLLITIVSATKTVEPIETPFGLWTWVGPKNRVLGEGPGPQGRGSFGENFHPIVRCKEYMSVMTVRFLRSSWRPSSLITMRHRSNVKKRWLLSLDALRFMQLPFVALLIIVIQSSWKWSALCRVQMLGHFYMSIVIKNDCLTRICLLHMLQYNSFLLFLIIYCCLQCFDAVDWASGRASGL